MGSHHSAKMTTAEWLTPPEILKALGEFDLDPCAPIDRPWDTARRHYTIEDDGLSKVWEGRVWLNPPYGREAYAWLKRMAEHGSGVALIFARTETDAFFKWVWGKANGVLFIKGRINFHLPDGTKSQKNAGAPSILVSYSDRDMLSLESSCIEGKCIRLQGSSDN
jgi:hypothetical protein